MFYSHFWCKAFWIRVRLASLYWACWVPGPGDGITSSDVETKPQGNDLLQVGRVVSGLLRRRACPVCCSASPRAGPGSHCPLCPWATSCKDMWTWRGSTVVLPALKNHLGARFHTPHSSYFQCFLSPLLDMNSLKLRSETLKKIKTWPSFLL